MKTLLHIALTASLISPTALAQQQRPPAPPTERSQIVVDRYYLGLLSGCRQAPDQAWTADAHRRMMDHAARLHGMAGLGALLGIVELDLELLAPRMTARGWGDAAPTGECARSDWDALRARVEIYRSDRTLDTPRRR